MHSYACRMIYAAKAKMKIKYNKNMVQTIYLCVAINNEENSLGFYDEKRLPLCMHVVCVCVYCIVYIKRWIAICVRRSDIRCENKYMN